MFSIQFRSISKLILIALLALSIGCTKSDSDDEESSSKESLIPTGLFSKCGVVIDDELRNPIALEDAVRVNLEPISTELSIAHLIQDKSGVGKAGDTILIKNQAVTDNGVSSSKSSSGIGFIKENSHGAFFISAGKSCKTSVDGGGTAIVGQLFAASVDDQGNNLSFNEELLKQKAVVTDAADPCGGSVLAQCYGNVKPAPNANAELLEFRNFLWKPESDGGYNPGSASILFNPFAEKILVNGQEIQDFGPGNGRMVTARTFKSGCAWGKNITVEAFDAQGNPLTHNGEPFVIVQDGCARFEFE